MVILSNYAREGRLGVARVGTGNPRGSLINGVESQGDNTGGPSGLEIHIISDGGNGVAVRGSPVGISRHLNSRNSLSNGGGGLTAARAGFPSDETGNAGDVGTSRASVNIGETSDSRTRSGVGGIGEGIPGIRGVANSGFGGNGASGSFGLITSENAGTFGSSGGSGNIGFGNSFGRATSSSGLSGGREDAAGREYAGIAMRDHGSGVRRHGRGSGLLGAGGTFSTTSAGGVTHGGIGARALGPTAAISTPGGSDGTVSMASGTVSGPRSDSWPGNLGFGSTRSADEDSRFPGEDE